MSLGFSSRYRKRKQLSLDGTVAGVEYNRYHRGYNRSAFDARRVTGMSGMVRAYDPDPGRPEFPESDYQPYEWEMPPKPTPPLRLDPPEMTGPAEPPDYDYCLMTDELSARVMREANGQPEVQEPVPFDHDVRAQEFMHSSDSLEARATEQLSTDPLNEMAQALEQQVQAMSQQPAAPEPPEQDPWEMQRRMYDQQVQMLMDSFMMGPGPGM